MSREKIDFLIKNLHLGYSISVSLTAFSVYLWITLQDASILKVLGIAINVIGLILWWTARFTLASNWSTAFGKPRIKYLVTGGIYSKIRHPLYLGIIITLTGMIIIYPEYWFVILSLVFIIYLFHRIKLENDYLSKKLGEEYKNYIKKTWF